MAYQPNEQQTMAIREFDTDLLVSAGAGTGKTSVLTSKYLQLLVERRAEVQQIVAITFTKKAAAEMRSRIQRAIRNYCEAAQDPQTTGFWQEQFKKIETARISTFHSLCLSLIREYPVEAGLPPATGVMSESEESLLLSSTVAEVLTESIQAPDLDRDLLSQMLSEFGWDQLANSLADIYRSVRESGTSFAAVSQLSLTTLQTAIDNNHTQTSTLIEEIESFFDFAQSQNKLTPRARTLLGDFRRSWPEYREVLEQLQGLDIQIATLNRIKKALPRNLPVCLKERVTEIHCLADALSAKWLDQEAVRRVGLIIAVLERIDRKFTAAKHEAGLLDFTDQQLLARDLLRNNPSVAEQIRQGIRYLMVDEFQDTNSLQLEIIDLLIGKDYPEGRLMAVGDIKQSIYRFRGAEAGVLLQLAKRFSGGRGKVIPLTKNYRSNQLVIRFVNEVAQRLFAGAEFEYEPLEAQLPDSGSRIELLCSGALDLKGQARLVARRIAQLVRESQTTDCPVNYGDIAILFRAGTAMPLFQQALQELGIPFYAAGGGNFYRRQEVVDQINLLRLVQQRFDSLALAGLLTSPYVALSEESLFWLGSERPLVEEFYDPVHDYPEISLPEKQRLAAFRELILFLQEHRDLFDIPGIIRLALERLQYRELLWTMPNAGQRLANLEKLLFKADEFIEKGYHSLAAFLAYIHELEALEVVESEAQTQAEAGDVVRLMTIHRSKGLEFPVVILPDLDRRLTVNDSKRLIFHKKVGIGFKIPLESSDDGETSLWKEIKQLDRKEETAESKRILYVALTRAKQQLILVGSGDGSAKGATLENASNWMQWLELLLGPLPPDATVCDFNGIPLQITREIPEETQPVQYRTLLEAYAEQFDRPTLAGKSEVAAARQLAAAVITLKVSEIVTFKECPRRFYLQYNLRLPEVPGKPGKEGQPVPAANLGAQIGIFLHQVIRQNSPTWPETLWQQTFGGLETANSERLKSDLTLMWEHLRQSEYGQLADEYWDEVPFQLKLAPNLRVEGRFDRLIKNRRGELVLVDYKTHRLGNSRLQQVAPYYYWQLQLYALAVAAVWGRQPDRAVLYFVYPDTAVPVPLDAAALDTTVQEVLNIGRFLSEHRELTDYPLLEEGRCQACPYCWFCWK